MNKKIIDPYWGDNEKTQVICTFEYEDGISLTASVTNTGKDKDNNPDWDQIFKEYKKKDLNKFTKEKLKKRDDQVKSKVSNIRDAQAKAGNESIFQAKIDAFQLPEIKESTDRSMKSKIRKAKTLLEVFAYSAVIIMKASEQKTTPNKKATKKK